MTQRYALFVDAGYLLAAGGWAVTGKSERSESDCRTVELITWLIKRAAHLMDDRELLRLYWYDAALHRQPTSDQLMIAACADTKLRLGHLSMQGRQKGVDALLLSDMTMLSRERSIDTAILLAGDGDFVEGVALAQQHGTRVLLWAISTPQSTLSPELRYEVDRVDMLTAGDLAGFFDPAPPRAVTAREGAQAVTPRNLAAANTTDLPVYATIITDDALRIGRQFAEQWARLASDSERKLVLAGEPRLPGELDFRLIQYALEDAGLGRETRLAHDALRTVREGFWAGLASLDG